MYLIPSHYKRIVSQDLILCQPSSILKELPVLEKIIMRLEWRTDQSVATAVVLTLLGGQKPTLISKQGKLEFLEIHLTGKRVLWLFEKLFFEIWPRLKRVPYLNTKGFNTRWRFDDLFLFEETMVAQSSLWSTSGGLVRFVFRPSSKKDRTSFFWKSFGISSAK